MEFKVQFNEETKRIPIHFSGNPTFPVHFISSNQRMSVDFEDCEIVTVTENVEHYMGDYEVIPSPLSVVLPTEKKLMSADVTVHAIPYFSVGNNAGGNTVYIGSEKEININ